MLEDTHQIIFPLPKCPVDNRLSHAVPTDHIDESILYPWLLTDLD